ncbi:MAG: hypothetical protein DRQ78_00780 [Epsilonproteobacteria bacterium]|nr:MAG: hypothetical protein DRQ78_00780 [Campylobacterota bacterium]
MAERNTFSFTYFISPSVISGSGSIAIIAHQPEEVRVGETLNFDVNYWIDPNSIPSGATPTTTIEWINHNGDVLGDQESISYTPDIPGWYSIQAVVLIEDIAYDFKVILSEGYTFNLLPLDDVDYKFSLSYSNDNNPINYSNMDIHRFLSYFPKWSSSHVNFFSNSSKFLSPQLEPISFMMDGVDSFMANNNTVMENVSFGYRTERIKLLTIDTPKYIRTEHGYCVNLGTVSTASLDGIVINAIEKVPAQKIDKVSYTIFAGEQEIRLITASTLYLKHDIESNTKPDTEYVLINGIDKYGNFITEKVLLNVFVPVETINEFLVVKRITGNSSAVIMSNYIESDITYLDKTLIDKRITDDNGIYFTPQFEVYDTTLLIKNSNKFSKPEEWKFKLPFEPDTVLVTNLLDVLMLKDNRLYSSKLMLDYYELSPPSSSVNNNSFIFVEDENAEVGTSSSITINTELLRSESLATNIQISIENNNIKQYLNKSGALTTEPNTWIPMNSTGNRIVVTINIDNTEPYIMELTDNTRSESYHAMIYQNKITPILIDEDVNSIFFHNKDLHIENIASLSYTAKPIRLGFITDDRYSYIQHEFKEMEFIYEN